MKIEGQVLTIEQMNHLKELGVEVKDTAFVYLHLLGCFDNDGKELVKPYFRHDLYKSDVYSPTLTLQEILEMLPHSIKMDGCSRNVLLYDSIADGLIWYESYFGNKVFESDAEIFLEAAYETLCWVAENGYLRMI